MFDISFMGPINRALGEFASYAGQLDTQSWLVICAIGMFVGYIALRGFGSRDSY